MPRKSTLRYPGFLRKRLPNDQPGYVPPKMKIQDYSMEFFGTRFRNAVTEAEYCKNFQDKVYDNSMRFSRYFAAFIMYSLLGFTSLSRNTFSHIYRHFNTCETEKSLRNIIQTKWTSNDIYQSQQTLALAAFGCTWLWFCLNISSTYLQNNVGMYSPYDILALSLVVWGCTFFSGQGSTNEFEILLRDTLMDVSKPDSRVAGEKNRYWYNELTISLLTINMTFIIILTSFPVHNSKMLLLVFALQILVFMTFNVVGAQDTHNFMWTSCIVSMAIVLLTSHQRNVMRRKTWVQLKVVGVDDPFARTSKNKPKKSFFPCFNESKETSSYTNTVSLRRAYSKISKGGVEFVLDELLENPLVRNLRISTAKVAIESLLLKTEKEEFFKCTYSGSVVALRVIPVPEVNKASMKRFKAELELLNSLRHPNIVQLMGTVIEKKSCIIGFVVEYMEKGQLRMVLSKSQVIGQSDIFGWEDPKCKFALDICRGMSFLHENNVIHRDFRTPNIFVSSTLSCKIAGFSSSKKREDDESYCNTLVGSPFWRSPEMMRNEKYNEKIDIFSFATMLLEIQIQLDPFDDLSATEQLDFPNKVSSEGFILDIPADTPAEIRQLILECGNLRPVERPSFLTIRRKLQKFFDKLQGTISVEDLEGKELGKLMLDQIIPSKRYEKKTYEPGETIIEYSDSGDDCYIISHGEVDIMIPTQAQKFDASRPLTKQELASLEFKTVATIGQYDYFGEMALMATSRRLGRCCAKTNVECVIFSRESFMSVFEDDIKTTIANRIIAVMYEKQSADENRKDALRNIESAKLSPDWIN